MVTFQLNGGNETAFHFDLVAGKTDRYQTKSVAEMACELQRSRH